ALLPQTTLAGTPTPVPVIPAPVGTPAFAGRWFTSRGILNLNQSGSNVWGTYTPYAESHTFNTSGPVSSRTLSGTVSTGPTLSTRLDLALNAAGVLLIHHFKATFTWKPPTTV